MIHNMKINIKQVTDALDLIEAIDNANLNDLILSFPDGDYSIPSNIINEYNLIGLNNSTFIGLNNSTFIDKLLLEDSFSHKDKLVKV